jgi:hypothetical protein
MTSTKYIGMDVHKESISIAVLNSVGKVLMECVIETKASMILQFIDGLRGDLQVTSPETRGAYSWLRFLGCGGFDKSESELLSLPLEMLNL